MSWRPDTALERLEDARAQEPKARRPDAWKRRHGKHTDVSNPPLRCGCGRTVPADMLTAIPPTMRGAFGGRAWACDACRERVHLRGLLTREAFLAAAGAPAHVIERARRTDQRTTTGDTQ